MIDFAQIMDANGMDDSDSNYSAKDKPETTGPESENRQLRGAQSHTVRIKFYVVCFDFYAHADITSQWPYITSIGVLVTSEEILFIAAFLGFCYSQ